MVSDLVLFATKSLTKSSTKSLTKSLTKSSHQHQQSEADKVDEVARELAKLGVFFYGIDQSVPPP